MIAADPPLILSAVALRRCNPRPGNRFFARDIAQWWLYPSVPRMRREITEVGSADPVALPMFAEVLTLLRPDDRQDLQSRLADWHRQVMPDPHAAADGWPLLGFLLQRSSDTVTCTPGHHPWHQMWNGHSPFWKVGPIPALRVAQLRRLAVVVPGYQSGGR